jgi:hypothetical protein
MNILCEYQKKSKVCPPAEKGILKTFTSSPLVSVKTGPSSTAVSFSGATACYGWIA